MDVDALSKGKGKDKKGSSGYGKGSKVHNNTSNVVCWNCDKSGHYEKDCRQKWTQDRGGRETKETARAKKAMARAKARAKVWAS